MADEVISGVGLRDIFRDKDGGLWKVLSMTDRPTVTLAYTGPKPVFLPVRRHIVIGSPLFYEYEHLTTKERTT